MLGKLMKHELTQTTKTMLPLLTAAVILSAATKWGWWLMGFLPEANGALSMLGNTIVAILSILTGLTLFGVVLVTVAQCIFRFYKNLLGDEGYLMFTLPVTAGQLVISKLLVSLLWTLIAIVLDILLLCFLSGVTPQMMISITGANGDLSFFATMQLAAQELGSGIYWVPVLMLALLICGIINTYLSFYFSMAIGSQFPQSRLVASVVAYIVLNFTLQFLFVISIVSLAFLAPEIPYWIESIAFQTPATFVNIMFGGMCLVTLVGSIIYYSVTRLLLHKKLNLA